MEAKKGHSATGIGIFFSGCFVHRHSIGLMAIALALFPAVSYANAGTPLMWAALGHLLLGNALIGLFEGLILGLLFRRSWWRCVAVMTLANYFSAWIGFVLLDITAHVVLDIDIYNARWWCFGLIVVSYLVTLVLEWPFVALCLRKADHWFRKSLWGSLVVQSASYLALCGWYGMAIDTSLYADWSVVAPGEMAIPKNATFYFIGERDHRVYVWRPGQDSAQKIFDPKVDEARGVRVFLRRSKGDQNGRWDIVAGTYKDQENATGEVVLANISCEVPENREFFLGGRVPRFASDASGWEFTSWGWSLDGTNSKDGRRARVALSLPFMDSYIFGVMQLPDGQVIFQVDRDQICICDPNERRIAMLAKGHSAVVTINEKSESDRKP